MGEVEGITDISPIQEEGIPEIKLETSPRLAGYFGSRPKLMSNELRSWVEGDASNYLEVGVDQVPIRVQMLNADRLSIHSLLAKNIFLSSNGSSSGIPLGSSVNVSAGSGPSVLSRENRQTILRVGANTTQGAALGDLVSSLEEKLATLSMPDAYKARIVGQSEQMSELFQNVFLALGLGCLFMYMILASLFESFLLPLTVMAAVPLAATGAVLSLLLFDLPLDLYGQIGMILLAGIVAKNSILLVDFARQRVRENGEEPGPAILDSAPLRLRPILMTSVAMIVGMLPVATGLGSSGAARVSLGIATIGGVISSTILTLFVVPNLYVSIENLTKFLLRKNKPS